MQAARKAVRYQALIVHSDADHTTQDKALEERILPGFNLVNQFKGTVCKKLLPIIPIQAIEAWMLADYEILVREMRVNLSAHELGIPEKAKQVESISKPKQRLESILLKANQQLRPRQRIDLLSLYELLGERIRLERLNQLTAYQQFVNDLTETLIALNIVPRIHRF